MPKWSGSTNHCHVQGAMNPTSSSNAQLNHRNFPSADPNPNRDPISVDTEIERVDRLEEELYERRKRLEDAEVEDKKRREGGGAVLTEEEVERVHKFEAAERVRAQRANESQTLSRLPHSYRLIRNLLWIKEHPVYRTALAEWESEENLFASRIGRKKKRAENFKNDIYQMIGFYSVFQGVLLTATAQSSYLHCLNVGLPIALSVFASVGALVHINRKFTAISDLQKTISTEEIPLKEVKARIQALKEKGEAFRFNDFQENKATTWSNFEPKFYLSSLTTEHLVLLAIILFSVLFILAHPLILCRPGKGQ